MYFNVLICNCVFHRPDIWQPEITVGKTENNSALGYIIIRLELEFAVD